MTTIEEGATVNGSYPPSLHVRIADLEQEHGDVSDRYIVGTVSLVWPYSSSTRKFSLLLSETDARPLKTRRQVRVTFHNGAAKAAQESRVGIGDAVKLSLEGCAWQQGQDEISTPGKRLEHDIEFRKTLALEVNPNTPSAKLVHYIWNGTPSPEPTPTAESIIEVIRDVEYTPSKIPAPFSSPPSRKAFRLSSNSFMEASLDPFAEDKEYVYGRTRKRTRFARDSGAWTLLDEEEETLEVEVSSPVPAPAPAAKQAPLATVETALQQSHLPSETIELTSPVDDIFLRPSEPVRPPEIDQTDWQADDVTAMPPPQTPARPLRKVDRHIAMPERDADETTTPRLHPLASPGLPLVSPLVSRFGVDIGVFPGASAPVSELDASSVSTRDRNGSVVSSGSDDSLIVVEPPSHQDVVPPQVGRNGSIVPPEQAQTHDVVEDEDMYGAPDMSPPLPKLQETVPVKAALSALDILEEFLEMSPTEPESEKPFHEAVPPAYNAESPYQPDQADRDSSRSGSAVPSMDGAYDGEVPLPPTHLEKPMRGPSSSPIEQRPLGGPQLIKSSSESRSTSEDEPEFSVENESEEVAKEEDIHSESEAEEVMVSDVAEKTRAQKSPRPPVTLPTTQLLPTPAHTQEEEIIVIDAHEGQPSEDDTSHLLTPNQTQLDAELSQEQPVQPNLIEQVVEEVEAVSPPLHTDSGRSRRVSQRLTRNSTMLGNMSSPYFTPRRKPAPTQPPKEQEDSSLLPSSPAQEQPSSPTQPARRRTAAPEPSSPVSVAETNSLAAEDFLAKTPTAKASKSAIPNSTGLATSIAYYAPLFSLHEHFNQLVDTLAICTEDGTPPDQAKRGPKDWYTTLCTADLSSNPDAKSKQTVQVFRPKRDALPATRRGDVVILRDFKVQTQKHKSFLLSTDSSAWAVFDGSLDERSMVDDPVVSGPPIEYGRGETAQVRKLAAWWKAEGREHFPDQPQKSRRQAVDDEQDPSPDTQPPQNDRPVAAVVEGPDNTQHRTRDQQNLEVDTRIAASAEEPPKSPRRMRRQQNLQVDTQQSINHEDAIASVERPPKSPVRTRRQVKLVGEVNQEDAVEETAETTKKWTRTPAQTPTRRQPSRRTKTPTASGITAPDNVFPQQAQTKASPKTTGRTRATKSPSMVHELRDGTQYVDDEVASASQASPTPKSSPKTTRRTRATKSPVTVHELRDGTKYVDDEDETLQHNASQQTKASPRTTTRRTRATKSPSAVHELRGGTKYIDDDEKKTSSAKQASPTTVTTTTTRWRTTRAAKSPTVVHELRDGMKYVDDGKGNEKMKDSTAVHELRDGRRYADDE